MGAAPGAEVPGARVQAELRHRLGREIGELELDDRLGPELRCAQRETHDGRLSQRHVDDAIGPIALDQPFAGFERRAIDPHVHAGQEGRGWFASR